MDRKKALGNRIRELRKHNKLSQERIAELIDVEPPSICNIENGRNYPTMQNLEKITDVLNVSFIDVFNFEHFQEKNKLIEEIVIMLKNNPDKITEIYKITKALTE